jgi:uroporphyrinogen-III synthase
VNDAPLAGCGVLVTRPPAQADGLCDAIESAGGTAIRFPVLSIAGRERREVEADLGDLYVDIVVFVSANAVTFGLPVLDDVDASFAAVGPATAAALSAAGRPPDIVPASGYDSEALLAEPALVDVKDKRILIVRGENGRELLADTLRDRGADVSYLPVYRRERYRHNEDAIADLERQLVAGTIDVVSVLSVETLEHLVELLPARALERLRETPLVAPGERVIIAAGKLVPGIPAIKAAGPRPADIVNALIDWRHSGQNA